VLRALPGRRPLLDAKLGRSASTGDMPTAVVPQIPSPVDGFPVGQVWTGPCGTTGSLDVDAGFVGQAMADGAYPVGTTVTDGHLMGTVASDGAHLVKMAQSDGAAPI